MDAQDVERAGGRVRLRLTAWQRVPFFFIYALIVGEQASFASFTGDWFLMAIPAVIVCALFCVVRWLGVTLTADAALVHNLRRRRVAWRDVSSVQVERFAGNRIVVLYEQNGRRTRLRVPISGFLSRDKRFEDKFDVIGQWWAAHRDGAQAGG